MSKQNSLNLKGRVTQILPGGNFEVTCNIGKQKNDGSYEELIVRCQPNGKMRLAKIKLIVGDYVLLEVSAYDLSKGRISWRYRDKIDFDKETL
jgi:translation initiation factor IF-1